MNLYQETNVEEFRLHLVISVKGRSGSEAKFNLLDFEPLITTRW